MALANIAGSTSRVVWEYSPKSGGKFHPKLNTGGRPIAINTGGRPIANKYREGKMQRTLKRELKVLEIVKREAIGTSVCARSNQVGGVGVRVVALGPWWPSLAACIGRRRRLHFGRGTCQHRLHSGRQTGRGKVGDLRGRRYSPRHLMPPGRPRCAKHVSTSAQRGWTWPGLARRRGQHAVPVDRLPIHRCVRHLTRSRC